MSTTPKIEAHERPGSPLRCALCHDRLDAGQARTCPGCGTAIHGACADEVRACPTLGCRLRKPQPVVAISPVELLPFVALGMLTVPGGAVVGLVAGSLFAGQSVEGGLFEGACLVPVLTFGGCVLGGLTGRIQREATRKRASSSGRLVVAFLLACAGVGGALLGFAVASRDRSQDNTDGPFR